MLVDFGLYLEGMVECQGELLGDGGARSATRRDGAGVSATAPSSLGAGRRRDGTRPQGASGSRLCGVAAQLALGSWPFGRGGALMGRWSAVSGRPS